MKKWIWNSYRKYVYGQKNRESHIEIVSETAAFKFREASVSKLRNYLDIWGARKYKDHLQIFFFFLTV